MTTHPTDALSRSPGEDDERRLKSARDGYVGIPEDGTVLGDVAFLLRILKARDAEIEDWRGRLAMQCGETLAARMQRDRALAELARPRATPSSPYLSLPTRRASDAALQEAVAELTAARTNLAKFLWPSHPATVRADNALRRIDAIVGPGIVTGEGGDK